MHVVMRSKGKLRDRDAFFVSTLSRMHVMAGQVDLIEFIEAFLTTLL